MQKTAYELRISDWSSDVCSSDLASGYLYYVSLKGVTGAATLDVASVAAQVAMIRQHTKLPVAVGFGIRDATSARAVGAIADGVVVGSALVAEAERRSEEHTSELQSLMRISYAVFCLKKKKTGKIKAGKSAESSK